MSDEVVKSGALAAASSGAVAAPARELARAVVVRIQRGDPRAFGLLVAQYQERVHAFVLRMCGGNDALADDMAQETFLRVFRSMHGFDFDGSARLSTWIFTIATRTVIDDRRRAWSRVLCSEDIQDVVDRAPGPERYTEANLLRRRVDRALLDVAEPLRAAFVLRVFAELSEEETAAVLGVELGTVKSRLSRVRDHLRRAIGGAP